MEEGNLILMAKAGVLKADWQQQGWRASVRPVEQRFPNFLGHAPLPHSDQVDAWHKAM